MLLQHSRISRALSTLVEGQRRREGELTVAEGDSWTSSLFGHRKKERGGRVGTVRTRRSKVEGGDG